jgi:hypothetical protein
MLTTGAQPNIVGVYNKVQAHKQAINLKNAIKRSDNLGNF